MRDPINLADYHADFVYGFLDDDFMPVPLDEKYGTIYASQMTKGGKVTTPIITEELDLTKYDRMKKILGFGPSTKGIYHLKDMS